MAATTSEILLKLKMISDVSDVTGNVKQIQQVLNKIDMPKDLKQKFTGVFAELERETKNYQNLLNSGFKGKKDVTGLEASGKRINALMKTLETSMKGIRAEDLERSFRVDPASIQKLNKELEEARTNLSNIISSSGFQDITKEAEAAANAMQKISKTKFTGNFLESVKKGDIQGAADALKQLEANHKQFKDEAKNTQYNEAFREMSRILGELQKNTALQETNTKIQNLKTELGDINITELQKFLEIFQNGQSAVGDMTNQVRGFTQANNDAAVAQQRTNSELDQLKSRIGYFFSLTNSVQLFKRAVTSALNTVKELDKTMTEAAVVTEFDVGDMWNKLPQYAKEAQKLGVSINGMYQATTLYYQQGLKTNAAMQLGIETMKMAKIAGMDSTEATKAMTAALRGFNMELNEMSATKVNDVYSQLAAVTAADTNQIATAMEKTASIAASANMEFETTAALLAQIIETTQEAPETAGTAMKTIIARFSEVKSLKASGQSTGQDEEGEGIDVNRIQTALRSVGISMDNFFAGTEGLDSILLKLAEKWDGLDFETQRYIATMAAGSRQQSRFIAMMSDYSRTTELVAEAQNSAGASQRQFNKTLESMESKLQRLSNAWNQFTMGLTNNEILKGAVDLLADMIEGVNKLTNFISGGNGLTKSIISLGVAIGGLTMGKQVVNGLFGAKLGKTGVGQFLGFGSKDEAGQIGIQTQSGIPAMGFKESFKLATNKMGGVIAKPFSGLKGTKTSRAEIKTTRLMQQRTKNAEQYVKDQTKALSPEDNSERAKSLRELNEEIEKGNGLQGQTAESLKKIGLEIDDTNGQFKVLNKGYDDATISNQNFVQGTQKTAQAMGKMANGMFIAGAACAGLSAVFQAAGWDEGAEAMSKLSGIVMGLGAVFMVLPPIITGVGKVVATTGITAQAAWGWIGIIAALIVGLVVAIVAMSKANGGLAKDIEKTNSQIDQMTTAAKEAEDALESITETRKELAEMQSTFTGLTKGTDEWRKALVDSNSKVLELLDTYPQLAKYITTTEDGLMEISTAGWDEIVEQQTQAIINTQAVSAGLQTKKAQLESQILDNEYSKGDMSYVEYQGKKKNYEMQQQATAEAFRTSAVASSDYLSNSDYAQNAAVAVGLNQTSETIAQEIEKSTKKKENEDEMIRKYAEIAGKSEDQVREQVKNDELTKEDMATAIATQKVNKETAKQMESVARSISNISDKDAKRTVQAMLTKDGKGLKQSDIEYIKKNLGDKSIGQYLSSFGITLDNEALKALEETLSNVTEAYATNLTEKLQGFGFKEGTTDKPGIIEFIESTDYGTSQALVEKITDMKMEGASNENINSLMLSVKDLIAGLNVDEDTRNGALAMLAESNWESKESIQGTIEYLKSLEGADVEGLEDLGKEIVELTNAVSENTTEQLRDKGYALSDLIDLIKSGEVNENSLTGEQKSQIMGLIGAQEKDFVKTGTDSWQYNGDLYSKTVNLYTDTTQNMSDKIKQAQSDYDTAEAYKQGGFAGMVDLVNQMKWGANLTNESDEDIYNKYYNDYKDQFEKSADYQGALGNQNPDDFDGTDEYKKYFAIYMKNAISDSSGFGLDMLEINEAAVRDIYSSVANTLGENPDSSDLTLDEVILQLNDWDSQWRNTEEYANALKEEIMRGAGAVQSNVTQTTSEIGWAVIKDENGNIDTEAQEEYNKTRSDALKMRLESTGGSVFVKDLEKEVKDAGKEIEDFADAINGLASDMAVTATKTKTFAGNMSKLSDNLNKDKRGTVEYGQALGQAKINVADYFGISLDDLDSAGISDQLYEELAAGNPAALTQMQNNIAGAVMAGTIPLSEAFANAKITPQMDQAAIEALYYQLGGAEGSFNTNMNESLKYIQSKLAIMGTQFAYQIDAAGNASAVTTQMDYSSLFKNYVPKGDGTKWKNEHDKYYTTYEKVNALLREREKLERKYDQILKKRGTTGKELQKNQQEQLENLKQQADYQKQLQEGKMGQIQNLLTSKRGKKYDDYVSFDEKTGAISIDWGKVNKLKGKKGEDFDEFLSELEGYRDQWQEAQDTLDEIEDSVDEIYKQGKDEYFELEDKIKQALIDERQKEIDKLSEINDSINDTNSKILDSMQEQIDEYRQNRDNQKIEDEIADKQRRLAYLQQDTSGANATEILKLQKEIDEDQESYTDRLIDQKISNLQKQNDQAAEQRQRQIEIAEAQLQHYKDSGAVWTNVYELWHGGVDKEGMLINGSRLEQILKESDEFQGMSKLGKQEWLEDLSDSIALAWVYANGGRRATDGEKVTFKTADKKTLTGTSDASGNVKVGDQTYEKVYQDKEGDWYTSENAKQNTTTTDTRPKWNNSYQKPWEYSQTIKKGADKNAVKGLQWALTTLGYDTKGIDGSYGKNTTTAVTNFQGDQDGWNPTGKAGEKTKEALKKRFYGYKTGGLADFTGPAWLDGTKSKPEYILNADQTKAFFTLVDVLSGITSKGAQSTQNNGDSNYDIDINVESIGSDYDVEQLASKIKSLINEDARYRNNNTVSLMR